MKKSFQLLLCLIAVAAFSGCGVKQPTPLFDHSALAARLQTGEYIQKVDNFLILMDVSYSMQEVYNGEQKFYWAKAVAGGLNDTIAGLQLNGGLRTFGNLGLWASQRTKSVCPVQPYAKDGFAQCIDAVTVSTGSTPIHDALLAAAGDIENLTGKTAIIVISDGIYTTQSPADAIAQLKDRFGDRVCVSSIAIGRGASMRSMTADSPCSVAVNAEQVKSSAGMADFAEQVFFEKKPAPPAPAPIAAPVVKEEKIILSSIMFDFDSSVIKPEFGAVLQETAEILKQKPDKAVIIEGHTCSIGPAQYNQGLSERRAQAVKKYLGARGIAESRLTAKGVGEDKPIADNTTIEGRKRNRRVEFHVMQ
jgi:OOP family OmpA-OmpF porin